MSEIPTEILFIIFKKLNTKSLLNCRSVCRRWKDIADADEIWKTRCYLEHGNDSREAYRKASLTWRQLYISLGLWNKIAEAKVKQYNTGIKKSREIPKITDKVVQKFVTLGNGIVSLPANSKKLKNRVLESYNQLVYYKLENMRKIDTVKCEPFIDYHETEEYILLLNTNSQLILMPKVIENKENVILGSVQKISESFVNFLCFNNSIYVRIDGNLCVIKINFENNNVATETVKLFNIEQYVKIIDIVIKGDIITILDWSGVIDIYKNNIREASITELADGRNRKQVYDCLQKYGFKLSSPHLHEWLQHCRIIKCDTSLVRWVRTKLFWQGKTVLVNTCRNEILIVHNPYSQGRLNLHNAFPSASFVIDSTNSLSKETRNRFRKASQMDIVEIENGHLIVVLFCTVLFVFECRHFEETNNKRKNPTDIGTEVKWLPKRERKTMWVRRDSRRWGWDGPMRRRRWDLSDDERYYDSDEGSYDSDDYYPDDYDPCCVM